MLPVFLVEETIVRESGESAVFDATEHHDQNLVLTFRITHAVEDESIDIDIQGSKDGFSWLPDPLARFAPKSYCGTYRLTLPRSHARYLKAVWKVLRWSRADRRAFFCFSIVAQPVRSRVATA